jgi:hypothetical protein
MASWCSRTCAFQDHLLAGNDARRAGVYFQPARSSGAKNLGVGVRAFG